MPFDAAMTPNHSTDPMPFRSGEQAWLWTSRVLAARRQGRCVPADAMIRRSCTPDDVLHCLAHLYRIGKIDLVHARVLRRWGDKGRAPGRQDGGDRSDYRQWRGALDQLEEVLRARKIVVGFDLNHQTVPDIRREKTWSGKNKSGSWITCLTKSTTSSSLHFEANQLGSLITDRAAGVSWPCTTKLLPLAVISPPNPDQLGVAPTGATPSFLVRSRVHSTFSNKEI